MLYLKVKVKVCTPISHWLFGLNPLERFVSIQKCTHWLSGRNREVIEKPVAASTMCTVQGRAAQRRTPALLSAVLAVDKDTVVCQWKSRYLVCDAFEANVLSRTETPQNELQPCWVMFGFLSSPIHFSTFPHTTGLSLTLSLGCRSVLTPTFVITAGNHILVLHIFSNCQLLDCMCVKMYLCCLLTYMSQHIMAAHKW